MLPDALAEGMFDVVVANILSNPLKVLAPMLAGRVKPGGHLILSGVLERQADEVSQAYAPWLAMQIWQSRDGWVCLTGMKP
jgi:ribosomal protein L11 methyltransferase